MRSCRSSFISNTSQKQITHATDDSQGNLSTIASNNKRFNRKNSNGSIDKKKSKAHLGDGSHHNIKNKYYQGNKNSYELNSHLHQKTNP